MIPTNNNFSVLPFYGERKEQDFRRWWQYGKKYPLYADRVKFIPFQIIREHTPVLASGAVTYSNAYIDEQGGITNWDTPVGSSVKKYSGFSGGEQVYIFKAASPREQGVMAAAYDSYGDTIETFTPSDSGLYSGTWTLPEGTRSIAIYAYDRLYSKKSGGISLDENSVAPIQSMELVRLEDEEELAQYEDDADIMAASIQRFGDYDVIAFTGRSASAAAWPIGRYYIILSDSFNTFYSDVFTCVENMACYLKIEWWDEADFVMDAGRIVYEMPGGTLFHNIVYLQAEIAKPEYTFEEEMERRDGYDFPTKQISAKNYRFSFFATEYLLDALRFIRMADHIVITNNGKTYEPSSFLITPEWEKEGDLAGVSAQFQTDTIAKKIGLAYIRPDD